MGLSGTCLLPHTLAICCKLNFYKLQKALHPKDCITTYKVWNNTILSVNFLPSSASNAGKMVTELVSRFHICMFVQSTSETGEHSLAGLKGRLATPD